MPLEIPKIDDRSYRQILDETLARIPVHNPEWTNFNESDPGVTILQAFAFMTESLLYRCNLIPERNRIQFLKLLDIPMQAAAAAQGFAVINNDKGPLETITLPPDLEVLAGKVPFRITSGLDVLPVEAQVYYKRKYKSESTESDSLTVEDIYAQLYASHAEAGELTYYETVPLESPLDGISLPVIDLGSTDIVDGSLWVALLARPREKVEEARPKIANKILNIGVMPYFTETSKTLWPAGPATVEGQNKLLFEIATTEFHPGTDIPKYDRLKVKMDTDILTTPGIVQVTLPGAEGLEMWEITEPLEAGTGEYPPSLEDTNVQERVITWIRIRLPEEQTRLPEEQNTLPQEQTGSGLSAKISWVGINATEVTQRAHVSSEDLRGGTGEPDQSVTLVNTPVISGTVEVTVNGKSWKETDDLMSAGSEVPRRDPRLPPCAQTQEEQEAKVFTVDRESGEIRFGDGVRGARPPDGAVIRASYDYGGGRQGNVNIGAINKGSALPSGLKVTNPLPTWGGDEAETVSAAEQNIPRYIRHRDRLVTVKDTKEITERTPGVDIGRTAVLVSIEPRIRFLEIPAFNAFFEARLYLDTGAAFRSADELAADRFLTGYGAGLRLWIGYPYFQNGVVYYGIRRGEGEWFLRLGSSF